MRVSDSPRPTAAQTGQSARRGGASDRTFEVTQGPPRDSAGVRAAAPIAGVDSLLALQEVDDSGDGRAETAVRQGREVLDLLDELKLALLSGEVSPARLARLERAVAAHGPGVADPGLRDVLDQIDLRARVELAKLGRRAA